MHPDLRSQGQKQDREVARTENSAEEQVAVEGDMSAARGLVLVVANIALAFVVQCD